MYVYQKSEPGLWTVGFYKPSGEWEAESDHDDEERAAERVAWLNGSGPSTPCKEYNVDAVSKLWNIPLEGLKLDEVYPDGPPKIDF